MSFEMSDSELAECVRQQELRIALLQATQVEVAGQPTLFHLSAPEDDSLTLSPTIRDMICSVIESMKMLAASMKTVIQLGLSLTYTLYSWVPAKKWILALALICCLVLGAMYIFGTIVTRSIQMCLDLTVWCMQSVAGGINTKFCAVPVISWLGNCSPTAMIQYAPGLRVEEFVAQAETIAQGFTPPANHYGYLSPLSMWLSSDSLAVQEASQILIEADLLEQGGFRASHDNLDQKFRLVRRELSRFAADVDLFCDTSLFSFYYAAQQKTQTVEESRFLSYTGNTRPQTLAGSYLPEMGHLQTQANHLISDVERVIGMVNDLSDEIQAFRLQQASFHGTLQRQLPWYTICWGSPRWSTKLCHSITAITQAMDVTESVRPHVEWSLAHLEPLRSELISMSSSLDRRLLTTGSITIDAHVRTCISVLIRLNATSESIRNAPNIAMIQMRGWLNMEAAGMNRNSAHQNSHRWSEEERIKVGHR